MNDKERIIKLETEMKTLQEELPIMENRMKESLDGGLKSIREMLKWGLTTATMVIIGVSLVISLVKFPH